MASNKLYAGIEIGGTTCVVAIAENTSTNILDRYEIPTTKPDETFEKIINYLKHQKEFVAIGIASFGPVDLNLQSPTYGYITSTPKPFWGNTPVVPYFQKHFPNVPIGFETDVNAPAVYECLYGNHGNITNVCYITLGTGVGIGVCANKQAIHGLMHPEGGHVKVPIHPEDIKNEFQGTCPFHQNCIEGMISSAAIAARAKIERTELKTLDDQHPVWKIMAYYIAYLCYNLALTVSPQVIIIGGGMSKRHILFGMVQKEFESLMNKYIPYPKIEDYIKPSFHGDIGLVSSIELGKLAEEGKTI